MENISSDQEILAKIYTSTGTEIQFGRDSQGLVVQSQGFYLYLPKATGLQALSLFSILETLAEKVEFPDEEDTHSRK